MTYNLRDGVGVALLRVLDKLVLVDARLQHQLVHVGRQAHLGRTIDAALVTFIRQTARGSH